MSGLSSPRSPPSRRYQTPLPFGNEVLLHDHARRRSQRQDSYTDDFSSMQRKRTNSLTAASLKAKSSREHFSQRNGNLDDYMAMQRANPIIAPPLEQRRSHDTSRSSDSSYSREAAVATDSWLPYKRPERNDLKRLVAEFDLLEQSSSSSSNGQSDVSTASTVTPLTEPSSRYSPPKPAHQRVHTRQSSSASSIPQLIPQRKELYHEPPPVEPPPAEYNPPKPRQRSVSAQRWSPPQSHRARSGSVQPPTQNRVMEQFPPLPLDDPLNAPPPVPRRSEDRARPPPAGGHNVVRPPRFNGRSEDMRTPVPRDSLDKGRSSFFSNRPEDVRPVLPAKEPVQAQPLVPADIPHQPRPRMPGRPRLSFEGPLSPVSIEPEDPPRDRGYPNPRSPEPRHATASLMNAAATYVSPSSEDETPKDEAPAPYMPASRSRRRASTPNKKNGYTVSRRRAASAWRPPSVWYENVEGVTLSTRPKSAREHRLGLNIPEIEARDILDIPPRGRRRPDEEDYQSESAEQDRHYARSPPPIGAAAHYVRSISPKPVTEAREHIFLDNYSRAGPEEPSTLRYDFPRIKRPAAERSGAQAIDAPEPIQEMPQHEEDFSDDGGAEPPDIARMRAMEQQDADMKSRTDQIRGLLGGMLKTFHANKKKDDPSSQSHSHTHSHKTTSPPAPTTKSPSTENNRHQLIAKGLGPTPRETPTPYQRRPIQESAPGYLFEDVDGEAGVKDDADEEEEEEAQAQYTTRSSSRDTSIWSPPRATRRDSEEDGSIYQEGRTKRVSFYGNEEKEYASVPGVGMGHGSTFASLGGPR
ncbi:hypothetical protein LTR64_002713 [Lithohypha guttulata]|uniref:uncharacterized protein n=1 Tax=Lithohypha guttulata TaxID=1690604 RepID=UPI002DE1A4E4|nr:hypothetical protein LTR51_001063 [Lithohypha guttulata]